MNETFYTSLTNNTKFPALVFHKDNWDDFGFKITFNVYHYTTRFASENIGSVKILDNLTNSTELSEKFSALDEKYCSLGQSLEYYENVKKLFPETFQDIFQALNDIAFDKTISEKFESVDGYSALFRFGSAEKAFYEAKNLLIYNVRRVSEDLSFTYTVLLNGATAAHEVFFDFKQRSDIPFRVNVLIGKNGSGKTSFLGSMVNSISGVDKKINFKPFNPLFNKVIAISYSLFDDFPKPPDTTVFSYKYIGLRTHNEETISDEKLSEKLRLSLSAILAEERSGQWFEIINSIIPLQNMGLNDSSDLTKKWIDNISYEKAKRLSSGQSIILFILTELLANIRLQSLILFDEPETHLHPTAIAQLINCFYEILNLYESYAIMSTHSPIIIQDIPSRYITVFDRQGDLPIIKRLSIESFGENISTLTSTAFGTVDVKELYKSYLESLSRSSFGGIEEINKIFDDKLSFNAQLYLAALDQQNNEES